MQERQKNREDFSGWRSAPGSFYAPGPYNGIRTQKGGRITERTGILSLFGGLALFLFGMDRMSRGTAAGSGGAAAAGYWQPLTRTPLTGALAGMVVTAVMQSSSATTVMVIGFVSAGLLELPQAVAVIFGANIGTTVTAQLLAFRVEEMLGVWCCSGAFFSVQWPGQSGGGRWGRRCFHSGCSSTGMEFRSRAWWSRWPSARSLTAWMAQVRETPLLGSAAGAGDDAGGAEQLGYHRACCRAWHGRPGRTGCTACWGWPGPCPVLLGDNVGTTITAILAAAGGTRDAKRAAAAHCCFNLSGSLVCLLALPWFVRLVELLPPEGEELEIIARQIANAHTLFNALCTVIWLPLTPLMVRLVTTLVPEKRTE